MKHQIFLLVCLVLFNCDRKENSQDEQLYCSKEITKILSEFKEATIDKESDSTIISYYPNQKPKLIYFNPGNDKYEPASLVEYYKSGIKKTELLVREGELAYGEQLEYLNHIKKYFFIDGSNGDTMVVSRPQLSKYYFVDQNNELIFKRVYDSLENPIKTYSKKLIYLVENNYPKGIRFYLVPDPNSFKNELTRNFQIKSDCDGVIETDEPEIDEKYSTVFYRPKQELKNCELTAVAEYLDEYYNDNKIITGKPILDSVKVKL